MALNLRVMTRDANRWIHARFHRQQSRLCRVFVFCWWRIGAHTNTRGKHCQMFVAKCSCSQINYSNLNWKSILCLCTVFSRLSPLPCFWRRTTCHVSASSVCLAGHLHTRTHPCTKQATKEVNNWNEHTLWWSAVSLLTRAGCWVPSATHTHSMALWWCVSFRNVTNNAMRICRAYGAAQRSRYIHKLIDSRMGYNSIMHVAETGRDMQTLRKQD